MKSLDGMMNEQSSIEMAMSASGYSHADRTAYARILGKLDNVERRRGDESQEWQFAMTMKLFAIRIILMSVMSRGMAFNDFKRNAARGDLRALLGTNDVEALLSQMLLYTAPEPIVSELHAQHEVREASRATTPCSSGCWYCCAAHKMIRATVAEAEQVWEAVRASDAEPHDHPNACPALGIDGRCRAYDVRPGTCRTRGSISLEACRKDLQNGVGSGSVHVVHYTSPFDVYELAAMLAIAVDSKEPFVNLLTTLRALRDGASRSDATAKGRRAHQRFDWSNEPKVAQ